MNCIDFWKRALNQFEENIPSPVVEPGSNKGIGSRSGETLGHEGFGEQNFIIVEAGDTLSALGEQHDFVWQNAKIRRDGQVYSIGSDGINPDRIRAGDEIIPEILVDNDYEQVSPDVQKAVSSAQNTGSSGNVERITQSCPSCKVAIVVGHTPRSPGAYSSTVGASEFIYNSDIANRTIRLIEERGGGGIAAQTFFRVSGGDYNNEIAAAYREVNQYLEDVSESKKIAIELHYNAAGPSASYALTLYKGDAGFAQSSADKMAEIYGVSASIRPYQQNPRGQATFINGPRNTYLMEPFFGTHEPSARIASTEDGKQRLAEVYADLLIGWIK